MSNVIPLFGRKPKAEPKLPDMDITGLVDVITTWAIGNRIDVYNDTAFQIRVADLMAHLQIMAAEGRARTA